MEIFRLSYCLDEDYPAINGSSHAPMADVWLEVDDRRKAGQDVSDLLSRITYRLPLKRRWPRVDCVSMVPGLGISARARTAFEKLEVPGMQFLEYRINGEPFFLFYTERVIDCLDRERAELNYFRSSPEKVKQILKYAFVEERLQACDVFTLPEKSDGMFFWSQKTFFTEQARAIIECAGLVGFRFEDLPV